MIIAFVGFKQVGKTTASQYLIDKYSFVRHNFKDALIAEIKEKFPDLLRQIAKESPRERLLFKTGDVELTNGSIIPIDATHLTVDELFTHKPPLMRALMQNYGTEVRRGDDDYYWTNRWRLKGAEYYREGKSVVVDDVRFLNEAEAVKVQQGIIIRLTRPDLPTGGAHRSETEQLQIEADYTIECEAGDFEKLYKELDEIVKSVENQ